MGANSIRRVSPAIGDLAHLEILVLTGNLIEQLPDSIGNLTSLAELDLGDNRLVRIPDTVVHMTNLKTINLRQNRLTRLPDAFGALVQLSIIDLAANELCTLPNTFTNLHGLIELHLENNQLRELPDTLGEMRQLRRLYVHDNDLGRLPVLTAMSKLTILSAYNNTITELPKELPQNLTHLYLDANPLQADASRVAAWIETSAMGVGWLGITTSAGGGYLGASDRCDALFGSEAGDSVSKSLLGKPKCGMLVELPRSRIVQGRRGLECQLGQECAYTLHVQDRWGLAIRTGGADIYMSPRNGEFANTSVAMESIKLHDNHDGTYTGFVPRRWLMVETSFQAIGTMELRLTSGSRSGAEIFAARTLAQAVLCDDVIGDAYPFGKWSV